MKAEYNRSNRIVNVKTKPMKKQKRFSWEVENTIRDRELLREKFERLDYRKQFPYSNDFIER